MIWTSAPFRFSIRVAKKHCRTVLGWFKFLELWNKNGVLFHRGSTSHIVHTWVWPQASTADRKPFKVSCSAFCLYPLKSRVLRDCQYTCTGSSSWVRIDVTWNGLRQRRETRQGPQMTHWHGTGCWSRRSCHEPTSRWSHSSPAPVGGKPTWSGTSMDFITLIELVDWLVGWVSDRVIGCLFFFS